MRKSIQIIISTILVFIVLTLATMKIETPFDGNDTYGFPFIFHITYSGMCDPCPESPGSTDYLNLLADLGVAFVMGIMLWKVFDMIRRSVRKRSGV